MVNILESLFWHALLLTAVIYTAHFINIKFKIIFNINMLKDMKKNDGHKSSECNSLMLKVFFYVHIFKSNQSVSSVV
jgi:hypothetical protein